jgi:hypothetical protein
MSVSGTYLGTVDNKTAKLSSTFTAVLHQAKGGALEGCMDIKPPLYGSGALHGSVRGSHVTLLVGDITFQGDASKNAVTGSYVVTRRGGNQLGDFRAMKQAVAELSYQCNNGVLTAGARVASPSSQQSSDVPPGYKVLPPAANATVVTPNASATGSKPPTETRAGPKQPDLSSLTYSEQQSVESACSYAKVMEGPVSYDRCLVRQLGAWAAGPKQPDLSSLTYSEQQSIESACSYAKVMEGPASYDRCLVRQLQSLTNYHR